MLSFTDIPAAPGPFGTAKTMIVMHGRGDVKESFITFCKELNVTGISYRLLDAPTAFMFGHSWYAASPTNPIPDIKKSIILINQHIDDLGVATENIFLAGFSQGGAMALEVAINSEHKFAGVIALSPRIFLREEIISSSQLNNIDAFIAHGEYDEAIPFAETQRGVSTLAEKGMNISFKAFPMAHEIDVMEITALRQWINEKI